MKHKKTIFLLYSTTSCKNLSVKIQNSIWTTSIMIMDIDNFPNYCIVLLAVKNLKKKHSTTCIKCLHDEKYDYLKPT